MEKGGIAEQSEQAQHREGPSWSHIWTFPRELNGTESLMKVLSYVIELFHVYQTVILAWSGVQDAGKIIWTFMYLSQAWRTQPGSCCHCHVCSSLLSQNLDIAEIQAHTWSRCSERLGLWGITNRVWHLLLLTALLRMIGPCCFASRASTVQQQWKITRELWTLSTAHD